MAELRFLFLSLSALGFYLLWVLMLQNGTLEALDVITKSGLYPNGRPLKTSFLGIPLIDGQISILVAFTDALNSGVDLGTRNLMIDVVSTLQISSLWVLIESLRDGTTSRWLKLPALWTLLWNGFGAGFILPLYYFTQSAHTPEKLGTLPINHAKSLFPTTIITLILPAIFTLLPPLVNRSPSTQQTISALFQISPLAAVLLQHSLARLLRTAVFPKEKEKEGEKGEEKQKQNQADKPYICRTYLTSALFTSLSHVYVLTTALTTTQPQASFTRIYLPRSARVAPAAKDTIFQGALLFLQYDWVLINVSSGLWLYTILRPHLFLTSGLRRAVAFLGTLAGFVLLGPGAVVSLGLWWREGCAREGLVGGMDAF